MRTKSRKQNYTSQVGGALRVNRIEICIVKIQSYIQQYIYTKFTLIYKRSQEGEERGTIEIKAKYSHSWVLGYSVFRSCIFLFCDHKKIPAASVERVSTK